MYDYEAYLLFFILFLPLITTAQKISPKQENIIFDFAKQTSEYMANDIYREINRKTCGYCNVNIKLIPAMDASGKVTDFGVLFSNFLVASLQAKLNSAIIKKYQYNVFASTSNKHIEADYNFDLNISYLMKDQSLVITKSDLISDDIKISMPSFEIKGDVSKIKSLNSIAQNANYDKIMTFNADNGLFEDLKIFDFKNNEIYKNGNSFNLELFEDYKFRLFLKTNTFL